MDVFGNTIALSFHPLKAGRRRLMSTMGLFTFTSFPSPQGGSETLQGHVGSLGAPKFPSPQGGSETPIVRRNLNISTSFHPLKAGRRPAVAVGDVQLERFPSPQGGSETSQQK